ncbi:MAG: hypothetical protein LQ345_004737 [Seirophora villosa]|nr:MAG: hypothetical protein LQ345_004737 [Seirophora villosa]
MNLEGGKVPSIEHSRPAGTYTGPLSYLNPYDPSPSLPSWRHHSPSAYSHYPSSSSLSKSYEKRFEDQALVPYSSHPVGPSTVGNSLQPWEEQMLFVGRYFACMDFGFLSRALNVDASLLEPHYDALMREIQNHGSEPPPVSNQWITKQSQQSLVDEAMYKELIDDILEREPEGDRHSRKQSRPEDGYYFELDEAEIRQHVANGRTLDSILAPDSIRSSVYTHYADRQGVIKEIYEGFRRRDAARPFDESTGPVGCRSDDHAQIMPGQEPVASARERGDRDDPSQRLLQHRPAHTRHRRYGSMDEVVDLRREPDAELMWEDGDAVMQEQLMIREDLEMQEEEIAGTWSSWIRSRYLEVEKMFGQLFESTTERVNNLATLNYD